MSRKVLSLADVEPEAQERKDEFLPAPYEPEMTIMILKPGSTEMALEITKPQQQRVAYLCGMGWTVGQAMEGIGLTTTKLGDLRKQAEGYAAGRDDGGAKAGLNELAKAVLFGQIQWREWLSKIVKERIATDDSPTLAVLAAKQASGLDWAEKKDDRGDGGPIKVEVTHRILTKEGAEIQIDKEAATDAVLVEATS